jgi:hypothetical protein
MSKLIKHISVRSIKRASLYCLFTFSTFFLLSLPAFAIKPSNTLLDDPAEYFPSCTCSAAFISFIILALALLIIAMFQYGEHREKKLTPAKFSIIGIILAFIIFSIPFWTMVYLLKPSNFQIDKETGTYKFSKYGEKGTEESPFKGEYTTEELTKHITESRAYIITSWAIMSIACVGAMAFVPRLLIRQAKKREEARTGKRKRRPSKGRVGTRTVKDKKDKSGKGEKEKGKKWKKR